MLIELQRAWNEAELRSLQEASEELDHIVHPERMWFDHKRRRSYVFEPLAADTLEGLTSDLKDLASHWPRANRPEIPGQLSFDF